MNRQWKCIATSNVNELWFVAVCLLLLSLSLTVKFRADSATQVFDGAAEQVGQALPLPLTPSY